MFLVCLTLAIHLTQVDVPIGLNAKKAANVIVTAQADTAIVVAMYVPVPNAGRSTRLQ